MHLKRKRKKIITRPKRSLFYVVLDMIETSKTCIFYFPFTGTSQQKRQQQKLEITSGDNVFQFFYTNQNLVIANIMTRCRGRITKLHQTCLEMVTASNSKHILDNHTFFRTVKQKLIRIQSNMPLACLLGS